MKKIISIMLAMVIAASIMVFVPTAEAVSVPGTPSNLYYDCVYAIDGANLTFSKPSGTINGYQIYVKNAKGSCVYNKTFGSGSFKKITMGIYKNKYYNPSDGLVKVIKAGQWYTIQMRAYRKSGGKNYYSKWSTACYGAVDVSGMTAKRSGKNIKVSWKIPGGGNSYYKLEYKTFDSKGKVSKTKGLTISSHGFTATGIAKSQKKMQVFIVLHKVVNRKDYRSDSTWPIHTLKI